MGRNKKIKSEIEVSKPEKPESESTVTATRTQRSRILAAGVMANFTVAFIAFLLFFGPVLGAIAPLSDAMILSVNESSPADRAGLQKDMVITQINNTNVTTAVDLLTYLETTKPGDTVRIHAVKEGIASVHDLKAALVPEDYVGGVVVGGVIPGSPAETAGIETGMTMVRLNNTKMQNVASFVNFMETTQANQTIQVELLPPENYTGNLTENGTVAFNVQLSSNPRRVTVVSLEFSTGITESQSRVCLESLYGCHRQRHILKPLSKFPPYLECLQAGLFFSDFLSMDLQVRDSAVFQARLCSFIIPLAGQNLWESGFSGLQIPCSGLAG